VSVSSTKRDTAFLSATDGDYARRVRVTSLGVKNRPGGKTSLGRVPDASSTEKVIARVPSRKTNSVAVAARNTSPGRRARMGKLSVSFAVHGVFCRDENRVTGSCDTYTAHLPGQHNDGRLAKNRYLTGRRCEFRAP